MLSPLGGTLNNGLDAFVAKFEITSPGRFSLASGTGREAGASDPGNPGKYWRRHFDTPICDR